MPLQRINNTKHSRQAGYIVQQRKKSALLCCHPTNRCLPHSRWAYKRQIVRAFTVMILLMIKCDSLNHIVSITQTLVATCCMLGKQQIAYFDTQLPGKLKPIQRFSHGQNIPWVLPKKFNLSITEPNANYSSKLSSLSLSLFLSSSLHFTLPPPSIIIYIQRWITAIPDWWWLHYYYEGQAYLIQAHINSTYCAPLKVPPLVTVHRICHKT